MDCNILDPIEDFEWQNLEQAAKMPADPRASSSSPSPSEVDDLMGEVSADERSSLYLVGSRDTLFMLRGFSVLDSLHSPG